MNGFRSISLRRGLFPSETLTALLECHRDCISFTHINLIIS